MHAYAVRDPPGPALWMVAPLAKNKPVPIEPPIAIIDICLAFNFLLTVGS
jgi:hypothetical protein